MGCDIHLHGEVKRGGVWVHHSEASVSRNYALFAKMANVRNGGLKIKPISKPKGLPDDVTELTKLHVDAMGCDGHSHSWLSAKEIAELHGFIKSNDNPIGWFGEDKWMFPYKNLPSFLGNDYASFTDYPEDWERYGIEDVRYVFFFDN